MNEQIKERWHEATNELMTKLEIKGIDFSKLNAIELFGRDGTWQTKKFGEKVKGIEIWEIDPKWKNKLKENIPNAVVKIRDSISMLKTEDGLHKFDLILIDNPMNVFGNMQRDSDVYCEHFEVLENFHKLCQNDVLIIFNVNRKPFDYMENPLWVKRRNEFYKTTNTSDMKIEFLLDFYKNKFYELGFTTIFRINVIRVFFQGCDMTHYFAYKLKKN